MTELNFVNVTKCKQSLLGFNQACITVISASKKELQLSAQYEECYKCDYQPWHNLGPQQNVSYIIRTVYPTLLRYPLNVSKWCLRNVTFKEYGVYGWNISDDICSNLYTIEEPVGQFLPLIVAVILLIIFGLLSYSFSLVVKSRWFKNLRRRRVSCPEGEKELGRPNPGDAPPIMINEVPQIKCQQKRVVSLDVFRGLTVALMIFVHAGGGGYWFFRLRPWNGIWGANLPFPWFQWIMGMGLAMSLRKQLLSSKPRLYLIGQVLRRSFVLFAIGVIYTNMWSKGNIKTLRITGVLQTLGVCYMIIGMIEILLMSREGSFRYGRWIVLSDIIESWRQWLVVLAFAGAHVAISLALPVPGCPRGYLGPGGWHMHGKYAQCAGGAAGYLNRLIFTPKQMFVYYDDLYHSRQETDVNGILPILSKVLLVYLGVHAGRIMQCYNYNFSRITRWFLWGLATGIIGGILCNFSREEGIIPVNWKLHSVSFVLATASMAFILLSLLYFVVDCHHWWSGAPFIYAGRNALLLFVGHEMTYCFPWTWQPVYNNHAEILARDTWNTALWLIIAYFMYRRNFFVTV